MAKPIIEAVEYSAGVSVWIESRPYDLAVKGAFVDAGWTIIDDRGHFYPRQRMLDLPEGYSTSLSGTRDPQLLAIAKLTWLFSMYGIEQEAEPPYLIPVPTIAEAELINRTFTGTEKSSANRRLAKAFKLDQPLPHSVLSERYQAERGF